MVNSLSMTFRCSNGIRQGGQLSPLMSSAYTDDHNHLQATGVGCNVGGAWVNSVMWMIYGVTCTNGNYSSDTLGGIRTYAGPHDIVYNRTKTVLCWSDQSNHRVGTQQESGSQMRNLASSRSFVTWDMSWVMTADCRDDKDIKKQFMAQNAVGNMLVRKFSFAPTEEKIKLFKSYCYPIYGCALWHHSYQITIRKLIVGYNSDTFKRPINAPWYTSSSLAFAMNATNHIYVVFRKFAYSFMSRVAASPNSIVTACHCQKWCVSAVCTDG